MQINWDIVIIVQVIIWSIVLFEWKRFGNASKTDKITFVAILTLSAVMSFLDLGNVPGPITLLKFIFGPLGRIME